MLLHQLTSSLPPGSTLRAFADDIGLVVHSRNEAFPTLALIFSRFSSYSSLNLNLSKTLLIPFSPLSASDHQLLSRISWSSIDHSHSKGKYLGIYLGPGASPQDTLDEILIKFHKRLAHWSAASLAPSYRLRVYNMFIHPLFSYYAQFYILPSHTLFAVQKGLQTLICGASHWLPPPLASRLRLFFHYPFPFRDLLCDNLASLARALVSHRRLPRSERRALRVFMAPAAKSNRSICAI